MVQPDGHGETLDDKIARAFERLRADGMSTAGILEQLYVDLRVLASQKLGPASSDINVTSVVTELWIHTVGHEPFTWDSGHHFVRSITLAMQQLVIDEARQAETDRPDGRIIDPPPPTRWIDNIDVMRALEWLDQENAGHAKMIRLIDVTGLTQEEVAEVLQCSVSTVQSEHRKAKARLRDFLSTTSL